MVCQHGSPDCTCPFAFTDASEQAQGYGCLPTQFDIVIMRRDYGKTWACHSDHSKPCIGAIRFMQERGIECKVIDPELLTEKSAWDDFTKPLSDKSIWDTFREHKAE